MIELALNNISKEYFNKEVLKNVSLYAHSPVVEIIIGPNGSGKTTLQKIIAGLIQPSRGEIKIIKDGSSIKDRRWHIGYISHYPLIYDDLTVIENLRFYGSLYGKSNIFDNNHINSVISMVGLEEYMHAPVRVLSYGWKKKADIVRGLLHDPDIVLLDEPFTGLDEAGRRSLVKLIDYLLGRDKLIVLTSPTEEIFSTLREINRDFIDIKRLSNGSLV